MDYTGKTEIALIHSSPRRTTWSMVEYMKDFDLWNNEKQRLELNEARRFHEREVWWCSLGINLGGEQDGKNKFFERPVLIVRKFNTQIAWVVPMSSKLKEGSYYHRVEYAGRASTLLLSQLRLVSAKRFRHAIGRISTHQLHIIQQKLAIIMTTVVPIG